MVGACIIAAVIALLASIIVKLKMPEDDIVSIEEE
jgi:hypothetical protein